MGRTQLLAELQGMGYTDIRELPDGSLAGLYPFLFTHAIIFGLDSNGYSHRYCYDNLLEARGAFADWDGVGDPVGYIKRKPE